MSNHVPVVCPVPAVFQFENHKIRTVEKDGEAWFVLKDVCQALTINNVSDVAKRLDDDEKDDIDCVDVTGRSQQFMAVSESGLYSAIMRSAKPEAKRFKKWVTSEVLPSIRKHGHYSSRPDSVALPQTPMEMFLLAADAIKDLNSRTLQIESRTAQVEDVALDAISQVEEMKANQRLEPWQAFAVRQAMEVRVYELQEKYGISSRMLFSCCWGFIKRHFKVPTYSAIAARRYDEALMVVRNLTLEQLPPTIMELAKGSKRTLAKLGGAK